MKKNPTTGRQDFSAWNVPADSVVVSCSGYSDEERSQMTEIVENLGGRFLKDFTTKVTILICREANSSKFRIALSKILPVVGDSWLEMSV
jgi:hypothetical protein